MKVTRSGSTVSVDLHGMRTEDARARLSHFLTHAPSDVREVLVIHGFNSGTALRDMIRGDFSHPRVKSVLKTLTDGQTRLILKEERR